MGLVVHVMWDLPGPGLEPMFPVLAGGFLTTVPPGMSSMDILTIFILLNQEHRKAFHLFVFSSVSSINVL